MDTNQLVIITKNITKRFGNFTAVKDINLKIKKGDIYALVGENGAGKTTLLKMLVGLLTPTSGEAYIVGREITSQAIEAKKLFGYVSDDPSVYGYLSGLEFLYLTGRLRELPENYLDKRIRNLTDLFPLERVLDQPMVTYSRGNKQKVAFLAALLSEPSVLFIDEPIAGLDPQSITILQKTIHAYAQKGNTIFLISHSLSFVEDCSLTVGLMHEGRLVKESKRSQIVSLEKFVAIP